MKRRITSDSIVYPRYLDYKVSPDEEGIREKFQEVYKDRIEELFNEFLEDEALARMAEDYPELKKEMLHSRLSERVKHCLDRLGVKTVSDMVRFSSDEFKVMRNFGKGSLEEVNSYVKKIGL